MASGSAQLCTKAVTKSTIKLPLIIWTLRTISFPNDYGVHMMILKFKRSLRCYFPKVVPFLFFNVRKVKPTALGPLEGKHHLERYSRVNALLKSIQCILAPIQSLQTYAKRIGHDFSVQPTILWDTGFSTLTFKGTGFNPFLSTVIGKESIPVWMRASVSSQMLSHIIQRNPTQSTGKQRISAGRCATALFNLMESLIAPSKLLKKSG